MCHRARFDLVQRKGLVAKGIHVEIYAAVVIENKIAEGICALDWKSVVIPAVQKPGVVRCDKVANQFVSPQLKMISHVQTGVH